MFGGYFNGLLLVLGLLLIGIQTWYILSLRVDGEIGNPRFLFLLLISVLSLLAVISPFIGVLVVPGFLMPVFLFLPVIALKISQYWEKTHGEELETEALNEEIGRLEYTIQKDPEHAGAHIRMGEIYLRLGEKDKALSYYQKALSLKPGDPRILDQIRFIEKKTEMVPRLTKSDLDIVKTEFKKLPLIFGLVLAAALGVILIIYLLHVLPAPVVLIIVFIAPVVLFFRWLLKS